MPSNIVPQQPVMPTQQVGQFTASRAGLSQGSQRALGAPTPQAPGARSLGNSGVALSGSPSAVQQIALTSLDKVKEGSMQLRQTYQVAAAKRQLAAQRAAAAQQPQQQLATPDLSSAQTRATTDFQVPQGTVTTKNFRPSNSPAGLTRVDHGYLPADTAAAFNQMRSAFKAATGKSLSLTEGWRSLADTAKLHAQNPKVNAPAGVSKHNWGRALDLSGMGYGTSSFQWLLKNAPRFGFSWDTGRRIGEPWHWEYVA